MSLAIDFQEPTASPAIMINLGFDSGEVNLWTRAYPTVFEDKLYLALAGVGSDLTVRQSLTDKTLTQTVTVKGHDPALVSIAMTENYQNRPAKIYIANVNEVTGLVTNRDLLFNGVIDTINPRDDASDPELEFSFRSRFAELEVASDLRMTPSDQAALHGADDSIFVFVSSVLSGNRLEPGDRNPF